MVPDSHISVNWSSSKLPICAVALQARPKHIKQLCFWDHKQKGSGGFHVHMECIERMMLHEHHLLKDNNQFLTVDFFVCCVQSQQTPE